MKLFFVVTGPCASMGVKSHTVIRASDSKASADRWVADRPNLGFKVVDEETLKGLI